METLQRVYRLLPKPSWNQVRVQTIKYTDVTNFYTKYLSDKQNDWVSHIYADYEAKLVNSVILTRTLISITYTEIFYLMQISHNH